MQTFLVTQHDVVLSQYNEPQKQETKQHKVGKKSEDYILTERMKCNSQGFTSWNCKCAIVSKFVSHKPCYISMEKNWQLEQTNVYWICSLKC